MPDKNSNYYLDGFRRNDERIINEYYSTFSPRVKSYILQNSGTKDDAKDVLQDATTVLYLKAKDLSFELKAPLYSYLFPIVRNIWLNKIRDSGRLPIGNVPEIDQEDEDQNHLYDIFEYEKNKFLERKMEEFRVKNPRCHELISFLLEFPHIKNEELAKRMGYNSKDVAKKQKSNCRSKFIQFIKEDPEYPDFFK